LSMLGLVLLLWVLLLLLLLLLLLRGYSGMLLVCRVLVMLLCWSVWSRRRR
jgi:hypothetical protein